MRLRKHNLKKTRLAMLLVGLIYAIILSAQIGYIVMNSSVDSKNIFRRASITSSQQFSYKSFDNQPIEFCELELNQLRRGISPARPLEQWDAPPARRPRVLDAIFVDTTLLIR